MSLSQQRPDSRPSQRAKNSLAHLDECNFPLSTDGQRQMASLLKANDALQKLQSNLKSAINMLRECAAETNDESRSRDDFLEKLHIEEFDKEKKQKVLKITERMEIQVRQCIDGHADVNGIFKAVNGSDTVVTQEAVGFMDLIKAQNEVYAALPMYTRYAKHHDYVSFKRLIHDAQYPDLPLPDATKWFEMGGEAEDDFGVTSIKTSLKCPLTLQEFTDPVISRCGHTFEKSAIFELLKRQGSIDCPVSGCPEKIAREDLSADEIMARRVKRGRQTKADVDDIDEV